MSFKERNGKVKQLFDQKSSGSEDNYQTEEEVDSEGSASESPGNFKNIIVGYNRAALKVKKNIAKNQLSRRSVPLKCNRFNRQFGAQVKSQKILKGKKCKKLSKKNKIGLEHSAKVSQKGKRCRLGGKAKGKPLEEEGCEKRGSDDDSDSVYIGRISLGYFQKFKDESGASTSNQWEEVETALSKSKGEKMLNTNSEELELLELQRWGRAAVISSCYKKTNVMNRKEDAGPEKF